MNILYFVSGLFNRLVVFAAMLVFARILDPESFGRYSLIISNALLLQIIVGSWISAGSGREFAVSPREDWLFLARSIAVSIVGISILLIVVAVFVGGTNLVPADLPTAIIVAFLTVSLICFETAQAVQNAVGKPKSYALTAIARGTLLLVIGAIVAYWSNSVAAVVMAQMLSNLAPSLVIAYRKRAHLRGLGQAPSNVARLTSYGMDGTLLFGYYIVVMAVTRNIVASHYDVALAGIIGLVIDFYFAPLALASSSLSLSFMPRLYNEGLGGRMTITLRSLPTFYVGLHVAVSAFYLVGTNLVIGHIAPPLLPAEAAAIAISSSFELSLFALGIMMIFSVLTVFLTSGLKYALRIFFALCLGVHACALLWAATHHYDVPMLIRLVALSQFGSALASAAFIVTVALLPRQAVATGR